MCTVTYIPSKDKIYLTSNRDEKLRRKKALEPRFYFHNDVQLIYPRDEDAGGTWVAVNNNGNIAVLLNGAFIKHTSLPYYRKSRGLVFLDIIKAPTPLEYFLKIDLNGIEPFTLVLIEEKNLYECRWDGNEKYYKQLENTEPHIWSSVTLYDDEVISKREKWFESWLNINSEPNRNEILSFHQFAGDGNANTDLLMNREGIVRTVSITSIELNKKNAIMQYLDVQDKKMYFTQTEFMHSAAQYGYHA